MALFLSPPLLMQPCRFSPLYSTAADSAEDSYVPMRPSTSPSAPGSDCSPDGYIPMSPGSATFTFPVVSTEKLTSPLPELPSDVEPPPVNRDLKPRRKCKPRPKVQSRGVLTVGTGVTSFDSVLGMSESNSPSRGWAEMLCE